MSKKPITRLVNIKPISISDIKTEQKENGVFMGYTENIISQIVEAREEKELTFICSQIQEFIEKENIDVCFVINKTELIDCLQEHQKLKMQIADLEEKLEEANRERHEEWKTGKEWKWEWQRTNRLLEEANQAKTDFAIEQLEKVKTQCEFSITFASDEQEQRLYAFIDQQIKELKEKTNESVCR